MTDTSKLKRETYSSPLVNYTEPFDIGGVLYTKFYTELNTELKEGDNVYILNGNYDNSDLIDQNEYQKGSTGYKVLKVDKNIIVLDIPYRTESPYNKEDFQDYTKVYLVDSLDKFNYENIDNGFGFDLFTGEKYSVLNNNIFLSQIENMPYTSETQTKDKFFKSYFFNGQQTSSTGLKGQLFNDSTHLNWELEETALYGLTPSGTGSSLIKFENGLNFIKDFDFIKNTNNDRIVTLTSNTSNSKSKLWVWDKKTGVSSTDVIESSVSDINVHYIKSFETGNDNLYPDKDNISIQCPANLDGDYLMGGYSGMTLSTLNGVDLLTYDVRGFSRNLILGYSDVTNTNDYRSFGFYSDLPSVVLPSVDNGLSVNGSPTYSKPYFDVTGGTSPFFVLVPPSNSNDVTYFPVDTVDTQNGVFNIIPKYANFSGIGRPVKVEINDWKNNDDQSSNLEYCFAGTLSGGDDEQQGGLYFYSYSGNYSESNLNYIGNAFELSKTTLDKYSTGGLWSGLPNKFNPFSGVVTVSPIEFLNNIKDVKWMGIEKKNFGLNLTTSNNGSRVIRNSTKGIYYTKYLVITSTTAIPNYYIYINFNSNLLMENESFNEFVVESEIPQVHCVIEEVFDPRLNSSVIGSNRIKSGDIYPYILDGEYVIGSIGGGEVGKLPISTPFDNINFSDTSVTSFDYSDKRWIVGAGNTSPRTGGTSSATPNGLYVYDLSISLNIDHITTGTTFSIGDSLPSDNIFKVKSEVIGGVRRVWAATDSGLFMFENDIELNDDYYYTIDLDNNEIPLDTNLYKNGRLYIMEDFVYDGINYHKGDILKWNSSNKTWVVDVSYMKPYVSKAHFEDGSFLKDGILDDGIFGNRDTIANWTGNGARWRNGILFNSNWLDGRMESKSDDLIPQSYYSSIKDGRVNSTTDFTNNSSYGYNISIGSNILGGSIQNGNFEGCIVGDVSISGLLDHSYGGLTNSFTYSGVDVNMGYFLDSDIFSTELNKSKIENSRFNSSLISDNSRIINSNSFDSIVDNATIENKGDIKIIGYDKWFNIKRNLNDIDVIHVHKFFIDEKSFNNLKYRDAVIFNNVITDDGGVTDVLDNIFYVTGGASGYYVDVYEDLNKITINGSDVTYTDNEFKLFVSKKIKTQNNKKSTISFNGTDLVVTEVSNENPRYSIDISIVVDTIPNGSDPEVYLNSITGGGVLKFNVLDISNSTIQNGHFHHSWINGGEWLNGSMITPNQLSNKLNIGSMSIYDNSGVMSIKLDTNDYDYEIKSSQILSVGTNVSIDNIWDDSFSEYVGGDFKISDVSISGSQSSIILEPYTPITTLLPGTVITQPMSQYKFINTNKIDGIGNSLIIRSGLFKNQSFSNLKFHSLPTLSQRDGLMENDLMVINSEITEVNKVDVMSGYFVHGQLIDGFNNNIGGSRLRSFKQVFDNFDISGGVFEKSAFIESKFNGGNYINNRYIKDDDLIPINNVILNPDSTALLPIWMSGEFNNGIIDKSVWLSGNFNNGKFLNSEFLGGNFNNGIFGDISSKLTINAFRKGTFNNGTFNNGIFGDNSLRISDINPIYKSNSYIPIGLEYIKSGTNIWNDGIFDNGIFTTIDGNVSLWMNGDFNNGQILDNVIWYDGIFNNGKFKSVYGRDVSYVVDELDIATISSISESSPTHSEYGSRVVDLSSHSTGALSELNQYNISTFREKPDISEFNNPGTLLLDKSDNQLKYSYVSEETTTISDPFNDNGTVHGYGEFLLDGFYGTTPSTTPLVIQFKRIDYLSDDVNRRNPLYNSNTLGARLLVQSNGNEYVYDSSEYIPLSTFIGMTISNTSMIYDNMYAWRGGVFNNGEFGDPSNRNNANPSWLNGIFNGGKFYGKRWRDGIFVRGIFNGSGVSQRSIDINRSYLGYNPQKTIERYITNFSNKRISIPSLNMTLDQVNRINTLDNWKWVGIWLDGQVRPNINELNSISERVNENTLIEYFKRDKFNRIKPITSNFNGVLWVNGIFSNSDANFNQSVWLGGKFNEGRFNSSMFNPYVQKWDFESGDLSDLKFQFNKDIDECVWNSGTFNDGIFYFSDWNNGTFENGTMVGGMFKKGMANYINAFSTIWGGGRFRNGNWYGSNFTINNEYGNVSVPNPFEYLENYFTDTEYPPFVTDILSNNANRLQDDRLHIWNIIGGSSSTLPFDLDGHKINTVEYSEPNGSSISSLPSGDGTLGGGTGTLGGGAGTLGGGAGSGGTTLNYNIANPLQTIVTFKLSDTSTPLNRNNGIFNIEFEVSSSLSNSNGIGGNQQSNDELYYNFSLSTSDIERFGPGIYTMYFHTSSAMDVNGTENYRWRKFPELDHMELIVSFDKYVGGIFVETNEVKHITSDQIDNQKHTLFVDDDEDYVLRLRFKGSKIPSSNVGSLSTIHSSFTTINDDNFKSTFKIKVLKSDNDVNYDVNNNNTLNGYIVPFFDGNYLSSGLTYSNGTMSFIGNENPSEVLRYEYIDFVTISVPTTFTNVNGAYAQYGNGAFLEGIWENGVWNNGYRGTEFGTNIVEDISNLPNGYSYDLFTYSSGATASVLINTFYNNRTVYQWRTSPTIYFNKVQRSFKTTFNRWRFILESAFNVEGNSIFKYGRLLVGDRVSVGNIVSIDINGNRKLIKGLFTVVESVGNRVTLEYKETFPIDDIQIDSDRHLIYVQKNVWLYGSFLNGWFEGIMNGGYIRGNREITKITNSHLIDVKFEGGRLMGDKKDLDFLFDDSVGNVVALSPQFSQLYDNKVHTTVVQHMEFIDDVTHKMVDMQGMQHIKIYGDSSVGKKLEGTIGDAGTSKVVQYIYNSDIDVVYEPEYFSSLFNQSIINDNLSSNFGVKLIAISTNSKFMYNTPAGYITYDILSSISKFNYSLSGRKIEEKKYVVNLGSKYKKYNPLNDVDFSLPTKLDTIQIGTESVNSSQVDTIPSTFNVVDSSKLNIWNRWFGNKDAIKNNGATFQSPVKFDIHEDFIYILGTGSATVSVGGSTVSLNNSLIVFDNEFIKRDRYHIVEVEVEFTKEKNIIDPDDISKRIKLETSYTYSETQLPKLTIGQGYNEFYENVIGDGSGPSTGGLISPYDNDFIPFIEGRKLSEINGFTASNRITMKTFMYNNFGGYRDNVKIFQKGFDVDSISDIQGKTVKSPIYYKINHYEIDQIPFFRYQDFVDPLTGSVSEWNILPDQTITRKIDSRVKVPFFATSVPIRYDDDNFILSENINFLGGTNIDNNYVIDKEVYNILNNLQ